MAVLFGADDILSTRTREDEKVTVILAGVWNTAERTFASAEEFEHSMEELAELAKACGMEPVCTVTQKLPQADILFGGFNSVAGRLLRIRQLGTE